MGLSPNVAPRAEAQEEKALMGQEGTQEDTVEAMPPRTLMHRIALLSASPVCTACEAQYSHSYPIVILSCFTTVQTRPCNACICPRGRASPDHQETIPVRTHRKRRRILVVGLIQPRQPAQREAHGHQSRSQHKDHPSSVGRQRFKWDW